VKSAEQPMAREYALSVAFLPGTILQDIRPWWVQCLFGTDVPPEECPEAHTLGALSDFASALVLSDGVVMPTREALVEYQIPPWVIGASADLGNYMEWFLNHLLPGDSPILELKSLHKDYVSILKNTISDKKRLDIFRSQSEFEVTLANYFAWEMCVLSDYPKIHLSRTKLANYSSAYPICDTLYLTCRSLIEHNRPTIKDILERPFASVMTEMGEIQLPLILAAAISRIDKPQALFRLT
jgi:hypothetical protein